MKRNLIAWVLWSISVMVVMCTGVASFPQVAASAGGTIYLPVVIGGMNNAGGGTTTPVGPNGGTVVSSDGNATLIIPPGALDDSVDITVSKGDSQPVGAVGPVYSFGPNEIHFALPAKLSLRYGPADLATAGESGDLEVAMIQEDIWVPLETTVDVANATLTAQIMHFTDFGIVDPAETSTAEIDLNGLWNDGGREVRIVHAGAAVTAHYLEPKVCDHQDGTGQTSETDLDFTATLSGNRLTGETSTCLYGEDNPLGVGIRMAPMELTVSEDGNELTGTWHSEYDDTDVPMALNRYCEDSGPHWVERFPGSRETADLTASFGAAVDNFIAALEAASATVTINATFRPPERAYLMHYAFRIDRDGLDPSAVPEMAGVRICWVRRDADGNPDLAASRDAADQMVAAYNIAFRPALTSRHTEGRAIDMNISWRGDLTMIDGSGQQVTITSRPRTGQNTDLHAVGASYGVHKLVTDRPHWSEDGH